MWSPFAVQCLYRVNIPRRSNMTQVHFTLKREDIQSLINESVSHDLSKKILTNVFNQLMERERGTFTVA